MDYKYTLVDSDGIPVMDKGCFYRSNNKERLLLNLMFYEYDAEIVEMTPDLFLTMRSMSNGEVSFFI